MNRILLTMTALTAGLALAQQSTQTDPATIEASLKYQTGLLPLVAGTAMLDTGTTLRYLGASDARKVIVDLWGNPPEQADDVLGMIFPAQGGPEDWGIVVTRSTDGHVADDDAAKTDYAEIMRNMQQEANDANAEREKAGYSRVNVVGWAEAPLYDAATHKMYWAKELAFNDEKEHTLNYAVRVLGRDSVVQLNAVGSMAQLPQVRSDMQAVLRQVSFLPGQRYEDFRPGVDKLAGYGIAALVGGVAAKKLGLLAGGLLLLKKGWYLLLVGLGALGRLFKRRQVA